MAKRLWDKGEALNEQVHRFTVGDDPITDLELIHSDLLASAAHAKMLTEQGLLTAEERAALLGCLAHLADLNREGKITIARELEDCHTAIESELIAAVGEAGRKIHTGRSRNDQVMVAARLYTREKVVALLAQLHGFANTLFARAKKLGHQPMPGYTHFQPAMPSSVQMWLQAFGESSLELIREGLALLEILNCNPLGAASGFGSSIPLDRESTAAALGFSRVQRNAISVQNSRGHYELKALQWAAGISSLIEKFASDMILYTTREFGFFGLPEAFTTGSSIMPQKHNPDVIELLRARASKVRGAEAELQAVISKLPSNYHRDFQYTKEPLVRGLKNVAECLPIAQEVVQSFTVNEKRLEDAMSDDLYATYEVYRQVKAGKAFREAYREAAAKVKAGAVSRAALETDFSAVSQVVDNELTAAQREAETFGKSISDWQKRLESIESSVFKA